MTASQQRPGGRDHRSVAGLARHGRWGRVKNNWRHVALWTDATMVTWRTTPWVSLWHKPVAVVAHESLEADVTYIRLAEPLGRHLAETLPRWQHRVAAVGVAADVGTKPVHRHTASS